MQRKKTDSFAIILKAFIILLIVLFVWCIAGYFYNAYYTSAKIYKNNWNVILPGNLKKQYYISDFGGGTGDGVSFAIHKLQDGYTQEDSSFFEGASFEKNTEMQDEIKRILGSLKVDDQKYPNFSHNYQWKTIYKHGCDKLYILYDTELSLVYFIQVIY